MGVILRALLAIRFFVLLWLLVFIFTPSGAAQEWGEISDAEWNMLQPREEPDAAAVVIFDNGELNMRYDRSFTLKCHARIRVFRRDGAEKAMTVEIPRHKEDKIKKLRAHTVLPDGREIGVKEFYEKQDGNLKTKWFTFPAVEDGCILEYEFLLVYRLYWLPDPWYFQGDTYVLRSRYRVLLDPGFTINTAQNNIPFNMQEPAKEDFLDRSEYTWELTDIPAAKGEPFIYARYDQLSSLRVRVLSYDGYSLIGKWSKIGKGIEKYFNSLFDKQDLIKQTADSVCVGLATTDGKIRRLHNFVRDEIATRNSKGKDPDLDKILKHKYAPSALKNLFLVKLLESQGISAHPLYIGTRDLYTGFNSGEPDMYRFNRVVCHIKDGENELTLDPAAEYSQYPYPPPIDLVEKGFLIDGEDSSPIQLKHSERKSGTDILSIIHIMNDGSAACSTTIYVCGYDKLKCEYLLDGSASEKEVKDEFFEGAEFEYSLTGISVTPDEENDRIQLDIVVELPGYSSAIDNNLLFRPLITPLAENPFTSENRVFPIDFRYASKRRRVAMIYLPPKIEIASLPDPINHRIDGALFTRKVNAAATEEGTLINVLETLSINRPIFTIHEYGGLREMYVAMTESAFDHVMVVIPVSEP
jgi:hypothetical protein